MKKFPKGKTVNKQALIDILKEHFVFPVQGMKDLTLGNFNELLAQFGSSDLTALPGDPRYEQIIQSGMILRYKERREYNGEDYGYHWGIDVLGPAGTDVFSVDDGIISGVVSLKDRSPSFFGVDYGNCVVVSHKYNSNKVLTLYGHLGFLGNSLREGQRVQKGEKLGEMGPGFTVENGGWPPHLHFQVALSEMGLFGYAGLELEKHTINPEEIYELR